MSGNIIFWKPFKRPTTYYDPILKCEQKVNGRYICKDSRVKNVGLVGYMNAIIGDPEMGLRLDLLFKNGDRKSFIAKEIKDGIDKQLISEAQQFLKTL